ncbi:MAG: 5'/3'-nucleotidase SurE [Desulfobacteraceae bacterium]|nr:5'/3'-nucleotidase SurE [Desulfobacteraceae bacterium]
MNILLTNDDGIYAEGLWALNSHLAKRHSVTIVAPDREKSAVGHGITLHEPLCVSGVYPEHRGYAVNGTPADCIKLGILEIADSRPDMVISGINPGTNLGSSMNYSGTVAAAKEAALYGFPAIAVSVHVPPGSVPDYEYPACLAADIAQRVFERGLPFGTILNVNFPGIPAEKIAGIRITRQHVDIFHDYYEKRTDPRNREYYWLGGDIRNFGSDPEVDGVAVSHDYISITPVRCDMTDYNMLEVLGTWDIKP